MAQFKYIDRLVQNQLLRTAEQDIITLLLGARQVGKTTLIQHIQEHVEKVDTTADQIETSTKDDVGSLNILHLSNKRVFSYNLDDINLRTSLKRDSLYLQKDIELSIGKSLDNLSERIYVFIDEIQKFPLLLDWIKQVFDSYSDKIKFYLTGSSSMHIRQASAETLAGRIEYVYVYPLSFSEIIHSRTGGSYKFFTHLLNKNIELISESQNPTEAVNKIVDHTKGLLTTIVGDINRRKLEFENLLQNHLFYGGLPRVFQAPKELKSKMIHDYIQVYLDKEIASLSKNIDLEMFGMSLKAFAMQNGDKLNLMQISKQIGISRPSLYNYLELLEATFLGKKIYPMSGQKDSISTINLYILDSGILNNLNFINSFPELRMRDNYTSTITSWILSNTLAQFSLLDTPPDIKFWQDYRKHKISLVIETSFVDILIYVNKNTSQSVLKHTLATYYKGDSKDAIMLIPQTDLQAPINLTDKKITFGDKTVHIFEVPLAIWG